MKRWLVLFLFLIPMVSVSADTESFHFLQRNGQMIKVGIAPANVQSTIISYRGFSISISDATSDGRYYVYCYRNVALQNGKTVSSRENFKFITASERIYYFNDSSSTGFRYMEFVRSAGTGSFQNGWHDSDAESRSYLPWCSKLSRQNGPTQVFTSLDYGWEWLQADRIEGKDAAINFGKKFVNYILGVRPYCN